MPKPKQKPGAVAPIQIYEVKFVGPANDYREGSVYYIVADDIKTLEAEFPYYEPHGGWLITRIHVTAMEDALRDITKRRSSS